MPLESHNKAVDQTRDATEKHSAAEAKRIRDAKTAVHPDERTAERRPPKA